MNSRRHTSVTVSEIKARVCPPDCHTSLLRSPQTMRPRRTHLVACSSLPLVSNTHAACIVAGQRYRRRHVLPSCYRVCSNTRQLVVAEGQFSYPDRPEPTRLSRGISLHLTSIFPACKAFSPFQRSLPTNRGRHPPVCGCVVQRVICAQWHVGHILPSQPGSLSFHPFARGTLPAAMLGGGRCTADTFGGPTHPPTCRALPTSMSPTEGILNDHT